MAKTHMYTRRVLVVLFGLTLALSLQANDAIKKSKQYKRMAWFWEARRMPDGGFPTAELYAREAQRIERRKRDADVQASPKWVELGPIGPDELVGGWQGIGRVNCLAISQTQPDVMFLGSALGGIWKTTNAGALWTPIDVPSLPTFGVSDIAIAPSNENVMYVATGDVNGTFPGNTANGSFSYGVLKSVDGGATWSLTDLNYEASNNRLVARLWVDPRNADIVLAATNRDIQRTTDGGTSWTAVSPNGIYRDMIGNPLAPDFLYATTYGYTGNAMFYRSTNNGVDWEEVEPLPDANRIRLSVTKANVNMIMAVASRFEDGGLEGVYLSYDKGQTFSGVQVPQNLLGYSPSGAGSGGNGWYTLAGAVSPIDPTVFLVGGVNIWKSSNSGAGFSIATNWTGGSVPWLHADQHFLTYHPSRNILYACHDGGIAQSTDNGTTWKDISKGLRIQQYYALSVSNIKPNLTIAGAQDNSTMLTTDGINFRHVLFADGMDNAIDPNNPNVLYGSSQNGNFMRSVDGGNTWTGMVNPDEVGDAGGAWTSPIATHPTISGTIYVAFTRVYKSTDFGNTWTPISEFSDGHIRHLAVAPSNTNYMYAATDDVLWYTTNGGETWNTKVDPLGTGFIQDIEVHPTEPGRYWVTYGGYQAARKIIEVNNGTVQGITRRGLANVPCNSVKYLQGDQGRLMVGTDLGVFTMPIGGSEWIPYGTNMPTTIVTDMEYISTTNMLRVSTFGRGIWEVPVTFCTANKPVLTSAGATKVCLGDTVKLEASAGFASYRWSNGLTTSSIVLTSISDSKTYWVNVEDGSGCSAVSDSVVVEINPVPPKPSITKKADTLVASAIGASTFQWFRNDVLIPGETQRKHVLTAQGIYRVVASNNQGCQSAISNEFDFITAVHETSIAQRSLSIHPNPTVSDITIDLPRATSRVLEILDIRGTVVLMQDIDDLKQTTTIALTDLPSGSYFVRIRAGASMWMARIIRL
ncbi:MAG: T9SS type A sorting domain-containing protein [bacterium]|nr:T9SS type A sorting domain-containing protein [bacterium]